MLCTVLCACGDNKKNKADGNYIYGQISSITGNDITLLLAEENETDGSVSDKTDSSSAENSRKNKGNRPDGDFNSGNIPEGFDPENISDGKSDRRNIPEGFDPGNMSDGKSDRRNIPEGFDSTNMSDGKFDRENMPGRNNNTKIGNYTLTGETQEIRIPVGVIITTALGVETDFDVLKTGDLIKCSLQADKEGNQTVTAVWIIE
jgi:hypothetical protein